MPGYKTNSKSKKILSVMGHIGTNNLMISVKLPEKGQKLAYFLDLTISFIPIAFMLTILELKR